MRTAGRRIKPPRQQNLPLPLKALNFKQASMARSLALLAVACFGLLALCSAQAPDDMTCALTVEDVGKIDFGNVKSACVASAEGDICEKCICSMSAAFGGALAAKGLDGNMTALSEADATNVRSVPVGALIAAQTLSWPTRPIASGHLTWLS